MKNINSPARISSNSIVGDHHVPFQPVQPSFWAHSLSYILRRRFCSMRGHVFLNLTPYVAYPPRHTTLSVITSFPALESYVRFAGGATKRAQDSVFNLRIRIAGHLLFLQLLWYLLYLPQVRVSVFIWCYIPHEFWWERTAYMRRMYVPGRNWLL